MNFLHTLTILASFSIAWGQIEEVPRENYTVQLKFTLREERIPAIINYLLNNSLVKHDITTQDIIQLSKLDKYSLDETIQVFNYYNITTSKAFSIDTLETVLDSLDLEFGDFYRRIRERLSIDNPTTQQVLDDLAIDKIQFLMALANDNYIYDILREGNYDEDHVNAALTTLSKTGSEVFVGVREILLTKAIQMNSTDFMNILKENGWNRQTSNTLWKALNITTRDVYAVEKFKNLFTAISDTLNRNLSIAVFVGKNKLAIHESVYKQFDNNVDGITIKIEADELEVDPKASGNLGVHIVELTSKQDRNQYIEITKTYDSFDNCTYSTIVDGKIITEIVEVDDSLKVKKRDELIYNLGSPLTCQGFLYGLAGEGNDDVIIFDRFYTEATMPDESDEEDEEEITFDGGDVCSPLTLSLILNVFLCFVLL